MSAGSGTRDGGVAVREWQVAGGVIERDGAVLLVENLRRNGTTDWTPPGGVVELADGESILDGLGREVSEETSLRVVTWDGPLYRVEAEAPGLGWFMRVEVHRALEIVGEPSCGEDPDGIVVAAEFCSPEVVAQRTVSGHPWVHEPLVDWLTQRWTETRTYRYLVEGERPGELVVSRR